jgi:thioesterase domain-containing protein
MARQLRASGEEVDFLGMFDTVAYGIEKSMDKQDRMIYKLKHSLLQAAFIVKYILTSKGESRNQFIRWKLNSLHRKTGLAGYKLLGKRVKYKPDEDVVKGIPEYLFKLRQANHQAVARFQLKPVDVKVDLFQAKHQTFYIPEHRFYGWKSYALRGVEIHSIPGEHSTIFAPPNDQVFGEVLQRILNND